MAADLSFLYIIGTTDGPLKIGHSMSPERRVDDFRREGTEVFLAGKWPIGAAKALAAERYVHWQLRNHHIRGEWFNVSRRKALAVIRKAFGLLDEVNERHPIPPLDRRGPKITDEQIPSRFPEGTKDRMKVTLAEGEKYADLIREAVERELKRRERRT